MNDILQRLRDEKQELDDKISKLEKYIESQEYDKLTPIQISPSGL